MTGTDKWFRGWMLANLARAARDLQVALPDTGDGLVWGWEDRSVGTAVTDRAGVRRWLRVGSELAAHLQWCGPMWTGAVEAEAVPGVPRPRVLASLEWRAPELGRAVRADLSTWVRGRVCAPEQVLRAPLTLPGRWWSGLREALAAVRAVPTGRWADSTGELGDRRAREVFGERVGAHARVVRRETGHGDLHWANLVGPELVLLDWELWGRVPVGADAADLYLRTLLVPETARRVHEVFRDVLDSPDGRAAQVRTAALVITRGQWPELEGPLRRHVGELTATTAA